MTVPTDDEHRQQPISINPLPFSIDPALTVVGAGAGHSQGIY